MALNTPKFDQASAQPMGYVYDDFIDNVGTELTKRNPAPETTDTLSRPYRLVRPPWSAYGSTPTIQNDRVEINDELWRPTTQLEGTWEFTFQLAADATSGTARLYTHQENLPNWWAVRIGNGGAIELVKSNGGTETAIISSSETPGTSQHTAKVTKDGNQWELFYDGASLGTATDSYMPNWQRWGAGNDLDTTLYVQRLQAYPWL